jgi:radical SAM protein with 4Fe4S-binding SPASM domain
MRDFAENPLIVIWEVTQACGLACAHCRAEARPGRDAGELTTDEGRRLLGQAAEMGKPLFVLTGGDPMERPDLEELVAHGAGLGLKVGLSPSATPRVTPERLRALRDAGLHRVAVSLDSASAAKHDAFRGVPGSFARTLSIAGEARRLGLPLQVGTTITRRNAGELEALAALVESLDVILWSVFFLVPTGRGALESAVGADEAEGLMHRLYDVSVRARFAVKTTEAPHYRRVAAQRSGRSRPPEASVNDAKGFVFVSHTGEVYPSGFLPLSAGNVRREPLAAIYRDSPLFRSLRDPDALRGNCGLCEYRRLCGGSRARAYAVHGDPLGPDPLCAYRPGSSADPAEPALDRRAV